MKNKYLLLVLLLFISFIGGGIVYISKAGVDFSVYITGLIAILFLFFLFRLFKSRKNGEVLKDELTKRVEEKAAARTFFISLYLWLFLSYKYDLASEATVYGIGGMAVIYLINYIYLSKSGNL